MALDPSRIRFRGKAISAAIRCGGSIEHEEAKGFFDDLHSEWQASGVGLEEADGWLNERLKESFRALDKPPVWIDEEPAWPFLDGKPMVFLCQCSMPSGGISSETLSPGETVYLFGGRRDDGGKTRMAYRTVSQYAS